MNENPTIAEPLDPGTVPGSGPSVSPPPPPMPPVRPQLRRSRTDRVFGGVCGGLAQYFAIDPVLIRILLVVATVFTGGAFVIVYVLAWIFISEEPLGWAPIAASGGTPPSYAAGGTGTFVDPATGQVYGPAPIPLPVRTEPRSFLGLIALSASVLVGGVLGVLIAAGVAIAPVVVAASMLGVLGIGMLIGARRGRARWLIAPAVVLLLITQALAFVPKLVTDTAGAGVGERRWAPTASQDFELQAGEARLDLTSLPAGAATVRVTLGLGSLRVIVPADTTVVLDATVDLGEINLPGGPDQQGGSVSVDTTIPATAPGGAVTTVELTTEIGIGQLEVRRASS